MSFAMSPGYTKHNAQPPAARSWGQRRRVSRSQPTLSRGRSAPLLLAQALHKRAAPDLAAAADDNQRCHRGHRECCLARIVR